jgi:hypothetical protein
MIPSRSCNSSSIAKRFRATPNRVPYGIDGGAIGT